PGIGRDLRQRGLGRLRVGLSPDRVVVRHGLAPVGDRARRGLLRFDERLARVLVDERMEVEHAVEDALLADLRRGRGEVRDPEVGGGEEGEHGVPLIPLDQLVRTRYGGGMKTLTRSRLWRRYSLRRTSR